MERRDFLKNMLYTSTVMGSTLGLTLPSSVAQARSASLTERVLVNVMLLGGADLRYLFVPEPGSAYAAKFWEKRKNIYRDSGVVPATYEEVWASLYSPVESNGVVFGIHKDATWLKEQFDAGNVAIVANVFGSTNRRHDHSQLIVHAGDPTSGQFVYDRDGWGGRLVSSIGTVSGADANVVPVSGSVQPFANGLNAGKRLEKVVHVKDSRNFALPTGNSNPVSQKSILGRALKSYYAGRGIEIEDMIARGKLPQDWPYRKFFDHESSIRQFGDAFEARLNEVKPNQHYLIQRLYNTSVFNRSWNLKNRGFGKQLSNLYDCFFATDILQLRTAYLEYTGWDTHRNQKARFEQNIRDIFGKISFSPRVNGGLDSLTRALDIDVPGANENIVYVFNSDFGRQLAVNGDYGTDHGVGSYTILVGQGLRGGVHGEMFPQSEIVDPDGDGKTRFDKQGADIEGRTSFEHILGQACDWVEAGTAPLVFSSLAATPAPALETGVDPATIFKPGYAIGGELSQSNGSAYFYGYQPFRVKAQKQGENVTKIVDFASSTPANHYWMDELSDGTYLTSLEVNPAYFTVDTPAQSVVIAGDNVSGVDFQVTPNFHLASAAKYRTVIRVDNGDGTFTNQPAFNLLVIGYNFVPADLQLTIGGQVIPGLFTGLNYSYVGPVAADVTGSIVVSQGNESYTAPVAFEDLTLGGNTLYV